MSLVSFHLKIKNFQSLTSKREYFNVILNVKRVVLLVTWEELQRVRSICVIVNVQNSLYFNGRDILTF